MRRTAPLTAVCLLAALAAPAGAADPFESYLAAHPETSEDDLIEVVAGDPLDRVLAVLHHPDLGVDPVAVGYHRIDGAGLLDVPAPVDEPSPLPLFVAVRQRCTTPPPEARPPIFSSWLLFREGRLRAWSLQPFGPGCRPEDALFETVSHDEIRLVGGTVFRRAEAGEFRYGALRYGRWSEAFAAPTPAAMLSRLEAEAAAHPRDAGAWNRLAVGLYATGERDRAVEALERAAALAPDWSLPHRNLAVVHRQRGDLAAAADAQRVADALDAARPSAGEPPPGAG